MYDTIHLTKSFEFYKTEDDLTYENLKTSFRSSGDPRMKCKMWQIQCITNIGKNLIKMDGENMLI